MCLFACLFFLVTVCIFILYFVGRYAPTLVDNLACTGDEDALIDCQHGPWGKCNKFTYYGDAGVVCNSFGHQRYKVTGSLGRY